jgi:hypothetical protein
MSAFEPQPSDQYLATEQELGFRFDYPVCYVESIRWDEADCDAGGDGHCLSFLNKQEVVKWKRFSSKLEPRTLVPFARAEDGDWLLCFDGRNVDSIYVIDLGKEPLRAVLRPERGYLSFLNSFRNNLDLPPWRPTSDV